MRVAGQGDCWKNANVFQGKYQLTATRSENLILRNFSQSSNCTVTCEGIYADVALVKGEDPKEMMEDKSFKGGNKMVVRRLISEYKEFKRNHVKHFRFNSETSRAMFGNL